MPHPKAIGRENPLLIPADFISGNIKENPIFPRRQYRQFSPPGFPSQICRRIVVYIGPVFRVFLIGTQGDWSLLSFYSLESFVGVAVCFYILLQDTQQYFLSSLLGCAHNTQNEKKKCY